VESAYRCLVVDHDDTSVMSSPLVHYPAHVEALRRLRPATAPIGLEGWLRKNFHPGFLAYLRDELGMSRAEVEASYRVWREFTAAIVPDFFPGMREILAEHKRRGGILVVASHSEADTIERDYRAAGAKGPPSAAVMPDLVFGWTEDETRRKPHPYPVLATMERYGLRREEILVLDDLKPGADMAKAAGVDFAAAGWGHAILEIREAIQAGSRWYFESVAEFGEAFLGPAAGKG
jgi:phosphoglycolate phosphatase-like HAD superfamily hydrolase